MKQKIIKGSNKTHAQTRGRKICVTGKRHGHNQDKYGGSNKLEPQNKGGEIYETTFKKFNKRQIISNWDRYNEELDTSEPATHPVEKLDAKKHTFQDFIINSGRTFNQFQFKDEREWSNEENGEAMLALNLEELGMDIYSSRVSMNERLYLVSSDTDHSCSDASHHLRGNTDVVQEDTFKGSSEKTPDKSFQSFQWNYTDLNKNMEPKMVTNPLNKNPIFPNHNEVFTAPKSETENNNSNLDELDELLSLAPNDLKCKDTSEKGVESIQVTKTAILSPAEKVPISNEIASPFKDTKNSDSMVITNRKEDTQLDLEDWLDEILG